MGLFGLFYALYTGARWTVETIGRNSRDSKKIDEAKAEGKLYYFSEDGSLRSVYTNHRLMQTTNDNGDNILWDLDTHREIHNYSKAKRDKENKDAKANGATVYKRTIHREIGDNSSEALWWNRYGVFVDYETGAEYNVVKMEKTFNTYFMDRATGLLVRPTDEELFRNDCRLTSSNERIRNTARSKMDYINEMNEANREANTKKGRLSFKRKEMFYAFTLGGEFTYYEINFDKEHLEVLYEKEEASEIMTDIFG